MKTPRAFNVADLNTNIYTFTNKADRIDTATGKPPWFIAIDRVQLTMTIIGAVVNIMTVITLQRNGQGFQPCVSTIILTGFIKFQCSFGYVCRFSFPLSFLLTDFAQV